MAQGADSPKDILVKPDLAGRMRPMERMGDKNCYGTGPSTGKMVKKGREEFRCRASPRFVRDDDGDRPTGFGQSRQGEAADRMFDRPEECRCRIERPAFLGAEELDLRAPRNGTFYRRPAERERDRFHRNIFIKKGLGRGRVSR
jgi:hypothetical protein